MSEADIMAQYQRGQAALEAGDYEAAISALTYVVDYNPELTDAQFLRGKAKVLRSIELNTLLDLTRLDLIRTIERDPDNAEAHYYLGLAHLQNETGSGSASEDAVAEFEQALKLDPDLVAVYLPQGLAYLNTQQPQAALDSLNQARELDPDNPDIYLWRAFAHQEVESLADATADFEQYLTTASDPFWRKQAETQLDLLAAAGEPLSPALSARYRQAKREFLELLRYTDDIEFMSESFQTRYDDLLTELTAIIQAAPSRAEPLVRRGLVYYILKRYHEAEQDFAAAGELAPGYSLAHYHQGLTHAALEQPQQALAAYDQAIALDPTLSIAHYTRALIYEEMGEPQQAQVDFEAYLALKTPENGAKEDILFRLTLLPFGDYTEQAQEHLQNLQGEAEQD
jgi:tetratricopeptide (TPR) repeat protein